MSKGSTRQSRLTQRNPQPLMIQSTTLRPSGHVLECNSRQRHAERTTPPSRLNRRHPHRAPGRRPDRSRGGMFGRKRRVFRGPKVVRSGHPVGNAAPRVPGGRVHRRRIPAAETRGRGRAAGGVRQPVGLQVLAPRPTSTQLTKYCRSWTPVGYWAPASHGRSHSTNPAFGDTTTT